MRPHTLVCGRLEGWRHTRCWPNGARGYPSRRNAVGKRPTALLLRMRAESHSRTESERCLHALALQRGRTERAERVHGDETRLVRVLGFGERERGLGQDVEIEQ